VPSTLVTHLSDALVRRRTGAGWGYHTPQVSIEATSLALLAMKSDPAPLFASQRKDGSWPSIVVPSAAASCWATALACITVTNLVPGSRVLINGLRWLQSKRGREAHLLWRWKFRLFDRDVRFNPALYGWPWFEGSSSWVLPTSAAIIALRRSCAGDAAAQGRLSQGVAMLMDRATPLGGWNAGNGIVYGVEMRPHLDATAIALLALQGQPITKTVCSGLRFVATEAKEARSGLHSLAWALLCLHAYMTATSALDRHHAAQRLHEKALINADRYDTATIALAQIALAVHSGSASPFEVPR
jgi:hypothetical protein